MSPSVSLAPFGPTSKTGWNLSDDFVNRFLGHGGALFGPVGKISSAGAGYPQGEHAAAFDLSLISKIDDCVRNLRWTRIHETGLLHFDGGKDRKRGGRIQ